MTQLQQKHSPANRLFPALREQESFACADEFRAWPEAEQTASPKRAPWLSDSLSALITESYAGRLEQFYREASGEDNEHPVYTSYDWRTEVEGTKQASTGYWSWVVACIERDRAMWPWDRESAPAVIVARAARVSVEQVPGKGWQAVGAFATSLSDQAFPSEFEVWETVARLALESPKVPNSHTRCEPEALPTAALAYWVSVCVPPAQAMAEVEDTSTTGKMRELERAGNHWVQVCCAAGVNVQMKAPRSWALVNGPDIPALSQEATHATELAAWRVAAGALLEHLRQHLECPEDHWLAKSPGQHLELVKTFYADSRPATPDFAFTQHHVHLAKVLCQNVGWRVSKIRNEQGAGNKGWQLNRKGHYFAEADAWLAGADRIRQEVMKRARLSYLQWLKLSLDEQISMGLTYAR